MESARAARSEDLEEIYYLAEQIAAELGSHRGGAVFLAREGVGATDPDRLRDSLKRSDSHLVVGEFVGSVLGYGLVDVETLGSGSKLARVQALVVLEGARQVGIGEAMMEMLVEHCRSEGCIAIDARALPGDRHTKNFFESFGLKARLLTVSKDL